MSSHAWAWEPQRVRNPRSTKAAKAEADRATSIAIREGADWSCQFVTNFDTGERCGHCFPPPTKQLQCSHIQGRGNTATRFRVSNMLALCAHHHAWIEIRPLSHRLLAEHYLGEEATDELERLSHTVARYRKADYMAIADHMWAEFDRIRALRAAGHRGYIQPEDWDAG